MPRGQVRAVFFDDAECDVNFIYHGFDTFIYLTQGVGPHAGRLCALFQTSHVAGGIPYHFAYDYSPEELGIGPRRSPRL